MNFNSRNLYTRQQEIKDSLKTNHLNKEDDAITFLCQN